MISTMSRRVYAVLGSLLLIIASLIVGPPVAHAAAGDIRIDDVTVNTTGAENITQWDFVNVNWRWSAPEGVVAGKQFEVVFPDVLKLTNNQGIELKDENGVTGGTCEAIAADRKVVCMLNDAFVNKANVSGHFEIQAQAEKAQSDKNVTFQINGTRTVVRLPGNGPEGIVGRNVPAPTSNNKEGWFDDEKTVRWTITLLGSDLAGLGNGPLVISDSLGASSAHKFTENNGEYAVEYTSDPVQLSDPRFNGTKLDLGQAIAADGRSQTLTVTTPAGGWNRDRFYQISYRTVQANDGETPIGTKLTNHFKVNGTSIEKSVDVVRQQTGSGSIQGVDKASYMVKKVLVDESNNEIATGNLPKGLEEGTKFKVNVEIQEPSKAPVTETIEVPLNGDIVSGTRALDPGSTVTLTEPEADLTALGKDKAVIFKAPKFKAITDNDDKVKILEEGKKAVLTTVSDRNIGVVLQNSVQPIGNIVSFRVKKAVFGNDKAKADTFDIHYVCTKGGAVLKEGDIPVKGDGTVVDGPTGIELGAECHLSESDATKNKPGYTWRGHIKVDGTDEYTDRVVVGATPVTMLVSNKYTQQLGKFSIAKTVETTDGTSLNGAGHKFEFSYNCGADIQGTLEVPGDGQAVTSPEIPAGSKCSITEKPKKIDGFDFVGPVRYSADSTITIEENQIAAITATNTYKKSAGTFKVVKTVNNQDNVALPEDGFLFNYRCTKAGQPEIAGNLTVAKGQTEVTSPEIPVDYSCVVTEDTAAANAHAAKVGATLVIEQASDPVVIDATQKTVNVTNTYTKDLGEFTITKKVVDADGVVPQGKEFTFNYTCTNDTITPKYKESGTLRVTAGGTATSPKIPAGSTCEITESDATIKDADLQTSKIQNVTVLKGQTATREVTNTYSQWKGTVQLSKKLAGTAANLDSLKNKDFTASYVCTKDNKTIKEGILTVKPGVIAEVKDVPVGSNCAFTEDTKDLNVADARFVADKSQVTASAAVSAKDQVATANLVNYYDELGSIAITKEVKGTASGSSDKAKEYTIIASWNVDGKDESREFTVKAGERYDSLPKLPVGTKVMLKEKKPADNAFSKWDTPGYSSNVEGAVVDHGDGTATVEVQKGTAQESLLVTVTNTTNIPWWWLFVPLIPFVLKPPAPQNPVPPAPVAPSSSVTPTPGVPAKGVAPKGIAKNGTTPAQNAQQPEQQPGGRLANTGASVISVVALAMLTLLVGGLLVLRKRRS